MSEISGYGSQPSELTPARLQRRAPWLVLFGLPALLLATLVSLFMPAPMADAATLSVCAGGGATYTTIQSAVNAANPGDVIQICSDTYAESVNLSSMAVVGDITLRGTAPVTIVPGAGPAVYIAATFPASITLENLRLTTSDVSNAVDLSQVVTGSLSVINVAIFDTGASGMVGTAEGPIVISATTVYSSAGTGVNLFARSTFLAENSSFSNNGTGGSGAGLTLDTPGSTVACGAANSYQLINVTADGNNSYGVFVLADAGGVNVRSSQANDNNNHGFLVIAYDACGASVTVADTTANGNGTVDPANGNGMLVTSLNVAVTDSEANNNVCNGIEHQNPAQGGVNSLATAGGQGCGPTVVQATAAQAVAPSSGNGQFNPPYFVSINTTANENGGDGYHLAFSDKITLTNITANRNDFNGIYFAIDNDANPDFSTAGFASFGNGTASIASSLVISNGNGIYLENFSSTPLPLAAAGAPSPADPVNIQGSIVCDNNNPAGVFASGPQTNTYAAVGNYWGSITGPFHTIKNPTGTGNRVIDAADQGGYNEASGDVIFSPWIDTFIPEVDPSALQVGASSAISFQIAGPGVNLGAGPGNLNDPPPFSLATNNGVVRTAFGQGASAQARLDASGYLTGVVTPSASGVVTVTMTGPCGLAAETNVWAVSPAINVVKSVGADPNACAAPGPLTVPANTPVYYCLRVTNTGDVTLTNHLVSDALLGVINVPIAYPLTPAASVAITRSAIPALGPITVTTPITNVVAFTSTAFLTEVTGVEIPPFTITVQTTTGVVVRPQPTGLEPIPEPFGPNRLYLPSLQK